MVCVFHRKHCFDISNNANADKWYTQPAHESKQSTPEKPISRLVSVLLTICAIYGDFWKSNIPLCFSNSDIWFASGIPNPKLWQTLKWLYIFCPYYRILMCFTGKYSINHNGRYMVIFENLIFQNLQPENHFAYIYIYIQ